MTNEDHSPMFQGLSLARHSSVAWQKNGFAGKVCSLSDSSIAYATMHSLPAGSRHIPVPIIPP
jgi:hypothetical protein